MQGPDVPALSRNHPHPGFIETAAWSGQPVSTPAEGGGVELTGPGLPKVTLLSPTPDRLLDLYKV